MTVSAWFWHHRRSLLILIVLLTAAGVASAWRLPVSLFPYVQFPMIAIDLESGDRPAERMALEMTAPVEEAVRALPGVRSVRSSTSRGAAEITVSFTWGDNMSAALARIEATVAQIMPHLPSGTNFALRRKEPNLFPAVALSLVSPQRSTTELRRIAKYDLRPWLITVPGVAGVDIQGGANDEYQVLVDAGRLAAYGLSVVDVSTALANANVQNVVGRLQDRGKFFLVMVDALAHNKEDIASTVLRAGSDGVVRVRDVATVYLGATAQWTRTTADGRDAVLVQIFQQPGGNTVALSADVRRVLDEAKTRLPADVTIAAWYDQSDLILSSADSVRDAILIGSVLAATVLLVFLPNVKLMFIAAIAVPTVLATTTLVLAWLHQGFNIMTLGGMAAAVGLIVDDAIVMVEHVVRRVRSGNNSADDTMRSNHLRLGTMAAAVEFTRPLAGSSLSTVIVFAPLAFLSGVTGAFFQVLSLTMAVALTVSFVVAWVAVPLLAAGILTARDAAQEEGGALTQRIHQIYMRGMGLLLLRPWLVVMIILPLLIVGWWSWQRVGSGFMPEMDEGGFILDYRAAPGTALPDTACLLQRLEQILRTTPEVDTYSCRTGLQLGGGLTETNEGDLFVRLKPPPRRAIAEVMDEVRARAAHEVPALDIETAQLMEDAIGDLTGNPHPVEIKLFADNQKELAVTASAVAKVIAGIPGIVDVKDGIKPAGDAVVVTVDRDLAALQGLSVDQVDNLVNQQLTGIIGTTIHMGRARLVSACVFPARSTSPLPNWRACPCAPATDIYSPSIRSRTSPPSPDNHK